MHPTSRPFFRLAAHRAPSVVGLLALSLAMTACGGSDDTTSAGQGRTGDITADFVGLWEAATCDSGSHRLGLVVTRAANNQLELRQQRRTYSAAACTGNIASSESVGSVERVTLAALESGAGWRFSRARQAASVGAGRDVVWGVHAQRARLCTVVLPQSLIRMTTDQVAQQLAAAPDSACASASSLVTPIPAPGPLSAGGNARAYLGLFAARAGDECLYAAPGERRLADTVARRTAVLRTLSTGDLAMVEQAGALEYADADCMGPGRWVADGRATPYTLQPSELVSTDLAFNRYLTQSTSSTGALVVNGGVFVRRNTATPDRCQVADDQAVDGALPTLARATALAQGVANNAAAYCPYEIDRTGVQGL